MSAFKNPSLRGLGSAGFFLSFYLQIVCIVRITILSLQDNKTKQRVMSTTKKIEVSEIIRNAYLSAPNITTETIYRHLALRIIKDMTFTDLRDLFQFTDEERDFGTEFRASLVFKPASEVGAYFPALGCAGEAEANLPTSEQLIALEASALRGCTKRVTSTTASFLKTLRDLSGAVVVAVGVAGLFAEKIPAKEVPTLMALAACSAICCALSSWGLKVWYPKNERND